MSGRPVCERAHKIRYRDELEAKMAVARAQRIDDPGKDAAPARVYRCPWCHGWHLTRQKRRKG